MINNLKFDDYGKLLSIDYNNGNDNWTIKVKSHFSVMKSKTDDSFAGKILENYREKYEESINDANKYYDSKKEILDNFINNTTKVESSFDYVQIFYPSNERRKDLLTRFSKKYVTDTNDYSDFFKKHKDTSIVGLEYEEAKKIFYFKAPTIDKPVKLIHIVDDTISKGFTISIFLDNLVKNNIIDINTIISATIIYNNYGSSLPKINLNDFKNR